MSENLSQVTHRLATKESIESLIAALQAASGANSEAVALVQEAIEELPNATQEAADAANAAAENAVGNFADEFDATFSDGYKKGEYVTYEGKMYRFTANHTGAWNASHAVLVTVGSEFIHEREQSEAFEAEMENSYAAGIEAATGAKPAIFQSGVYKTVAEGQPVVHSDDADYVCTRFPVSEGDVVYMNGAGQDGLYRLYVMIDLSGKAVTQSDVDLVGKRRVMIPAGVAEIAINSYLGQMPSGYYAVKDSSFVAESQNVSYRLTEYYQGAINATGGEGNSAVYCRTGYFPYDAIEGIKKPAGVGVIVYFYSSMSQSGFIDRDTTSLTGSAAAEYNRPQFRARFNEENTKYVRFTVVRTVGNEQINSTPEDILESGLDINISGASDSVYQRLIGCEKKGDISHYLDYVSGTVNSSGQTAASTDYWRTDYLPIGQVNRLVKPLGLNAIVSMFDAQKGLIRRSSVGIAEAADYDADKIAYLFGENGSTVYLIVSVSKYNTDIGATAPTSIDDILACGFELYVKGSTDDIKEKLFLTQKNRIPEYYFTTGYLDGKIDQINELEDSVSTDSDNFIFITDYHFARNAEKSPAIIKRIVEKTGITKVVFGGDAGRSQLAANKYMAAREDCRVFQTLRECAPELYGVIGNHDWNDTQDVTHEGAKQQEVFSTAGVVNFYVGEQKTRVEGMSAEGNYYIDNPSQKIRYFFLQETGQAKTTNETIKWLGDQLLNTPDGYYVVVFCHYAYTGAPIDTFDRGTMTGRGNLAVIRITQLLGAVKAQGSVTVAKYARYDTTGTQDGTETFDFSGTDLTPIAIFSGHTHWDAALTPSQSEYGILTIATTTDAAGYAQNGQTGAAEPRTVGTVEEQAFDVVQIDLNARKVYMTRIGGGSDREFTF